jgi:hypothetical protein
MTTIITYGEGGFCADCKKSHEHPLNNIIGQHHVEDPQPSAEELARQSALSKLTALGLSTEEVNALIGNN